VSAAAQPEYRPLHVYGRRAPAAGAAQAPVSFRLAVRRDVPVIHALISAHVAEGHLLPRSRADVARHVDRFVVATQHGRIVACADLAPIGPTVAELRSLVVDASARSAGVATRLIDQLAKRAASEGRETICAFTHTPQYFVDKGFTVVAHSEVPQKIEADCRTCAQFGRCGQSAVILPLCATGRAAASQQVPARHV
jgi:N-acetylglutamate synthase-like GNAT family acetyltransferase